MRAWIFPSETAWRWTDNEKVEDSPGCRGVIGSSYFFAIVDASSVTEENNGGRIGQSKVGMFDWHLC
jgi:hypothetical protein